MKKNVILTLIMAMALSLTACGSSDNNIEQLQAENESLKVELESIKEVNEALISEISSIQETEVTTIETIVSETTTTIEEPVSESIWKQKFFVDDFDRPTDECFVYGHTEGTFSNSATTKSPLSVSFIVERYLDYNDEISDAVGIILYEYGSNQVNNIFSDGKYYNIQILEENDNIISEQGYIPGKSDRMYVWAEKDQNSIINAFKNNQKLTIRIDEEDGIDTYLFDVDCTGFKELFDSIDWNV